MTSDRPSEADLRLAQKHFDKSRMPKHALSRPHLVAIGLVAAEWSALEDEIHRSILLACEVNYSKLAILTYSLGASTLLDVLLKFIAKSSKYKPTLSDCRLVIEKIITPLRVHRNDIVHGVWYAVSEWVIGGDESETEVRLRPPKPTANANTKSRSGEYKAIEFTPAQMRDVANQIYKARLLLHAVMRSKLTPSQRKLLGSIRLASDKSRHSLPKQ